MTKDFRYWTMQEIKYLKENYEDTNNKALSKKLDRTTVALRHKATELGLKKANEYALYKGDDLLYTGTIDELADWHGVKTKTMHHYMTPSYPKKRKNPEKALRVIKLEN